MPSCKYRNSEGGIPFAAQGTEERAAVRPNPYEGIEVGCEKAETNTFFLEREKDEALAVISGS